MAHDHRKERRVAQREVVVAAQERVAVQELRELQIPAVAVAVARLVVAAIHPVLVALAAAVLLSSECPTPFLLRSPLA